MPSAVIYAFDFICVLTGAYSRWDVMYPEVKAKIIAVESNFQTIMETLDAQALLKYNNEGPASAVQFTTQQCMQLGDSLVQQWGAFFGEIFMKYRDGYVISVNDENQACGCSPANAPYSSQWYDRIVKDTGDHYLVPAAGKVGGQKGGLLSKNDSKLKLLSRR